MRVALWLTLAQGMQGGRGGGVFCRVRRQTLLFSSLVSRTRWGRLNLVVRCLAGKQTDLASIPLRPSFLFKSCDLWTFVFRLYPSSPPPFPVPPSPHPCQSSSQPFLSPVVREWCASVCVCVCVCARVRACVRGWVCKCCYCYCRAPCAATLRGRMGAAQISFIIIITTPSVCLQSLFRSFLLKLRANQTSLSNKTYQPKIRFS